MNRSLLALLILFVLIISQSFGEEADAPAFQQRIDDTSTLRLYFSPELSNPRIGQGAFKPEVARLFVDDLFVGNAIVNLHSHLPMLKFGKGLHTIRVELNDQKFQSTVTFLGRGSTQILFVDFDAPPAASKN